ncbi:helix-turn-helix domain-containing protein [Streptomyces sp. NRRL F-5135]|uniref:helix-turn-helix domain-containing protein n=1 Tax=Streptomyces sp. NRRL F-5135 TaxID=1463858 RepID=UPI00068D1F16|nr:helix-turn-helix transcriptional regulator [Streptomyces sp. NRRL F-5135]
MTNDAERTELSDLVRERRAELGLSLRALAARCIDPEGTDEPLWKFAVLNRLERGLPVIPPKLPELRALAAGLDTHLLIVQGAAGWQFMGIEAAWESSMRERTLLEGYLALSSADQDRVRSIIRAWGSVDRTLD